MQPETQKLLLVGCRNWPHRSKMRWTRWGAAPGLAQLNPHAPLPLLLLTEATAVGVCLQATSSGTPLISREERQKLAGMLQSLAQQLPTTIGAIADAHHANKRALVSRSHGLPGCEARTCSTADSAWL